MSTKLQVYFPVGSGYGWQLRNNFVIATAVFFSECKCELKDSDFRNFPKILQYLSSGIEKYRHLTNAKDIFINVATYVAKESDTQLNFGICETISDGTNGFQYVNATIIQSQTYARIGVFYDAKLRKYCVEVPDFATNPKKVFGILCRDFKDFILNPVKLITKYFTELPTDNKCSCGVDLVCLCSHRSVLDSFEKDPKDDGSNWRKAYDAKMEYFKNSDNDEANIEMHKELAKLQSKFVKLALERNVEMFSNYFKNDNTIYISAKIIYESIKKIKS